MGDTKAIPFKISVLIFIKDDDGRFLLLKRNKSPNLNCWSPVGGKLEMSIGESPFECAIREVEEETGHIINNDDLHLFATIAEKDYEASGHWLMFIFDCHKPIKSLPPQIDEGFFEFFSREEVDDIDLPVTDRKLLWPNYDNYRESFVAIRADCHPDKDLEIVIEDDHKNRH